MGLGTPPQHGDNPPSPSPKGSQAMQEVSHSFHFISNFTRINPPGSWSPLKNTIGKIQGDGGAMDQSQPRAAPTPARADLCRAGAAGVPASLCPRLYG